MPISRGRDLLQKIGEQTSLNGLHSETGSKRGNEGCDCTACEGLNVCVGRCLGHGVSPSGFTVDSYGRTCGTVGTEFQMGFSQILINGLLENLFFQETNDSLHDALGRFGGRF